MPQLTFFHYSPLHREYDKFNDFYVLFAHFCGHGKLKTNAASHYVFISR